MTTTQPGIKTTRFDANTVRQASDGKWRDILARLSIELPAHAKQHGPCPACGGKDRFRFDDQDGRGTWFCNQCTPQAGDGFALVMNVHSCAFPEALRLVAGVLGITPPSHKPLPRPTSRPIPVDRVKLAFKLDMAALDRQLRAKRIFDAAKGLDVSSLNEAELDRALAHVTQAYADVERAKLFESVADGLRTRHFSERKAMNDNLALLEQAAMAPLGPPAAMETNASRVLDAVYVFLGRFVAYPSEPCACGSLPLDRLMPI